MTTDRAWICRACGAGQRHFYQAVSVASYVDLDEYDENIGYGAWEDIEHHGDVYCEACGGYAERWQPGLDDLEASATGADDDDDQVPDPDPPPLTPLAALRAVMASNDTLSTYEVNMLVAARDAAEADADAFDPESGD